MKPQTRKDEEVTSFFYKWNRTEKSNTISIIDFDLLYDGHRFPGRYSSRSQILSVLRELQKEYQHQTQKNALVEAKLKASEYYLRALEGEAIAFEDYIKHTMGIKPMYIPEDDLLKQRELVRSAYKNVGYTWDKKGIAAFKKDYRLTKEEIEKSFIDFREKIVLQVMDWLEMKFNLSYEVSFVDKNEYWMNWISTDKRGRIHLQYNLNKRHAWLKGSTEFLVFHEICGHAIQATSWKEQIMQKNMPRSLGLTTVFSPEQFFMEGIAESLYYFYPSNPFSDFGLISLHFDHLYWMVWNNAHIMANSHENRKRIHEFIHTYMPAMSENEIDVGIKEKTSDPLGRTYQYIYGISLHYHRLIAKKLTAEEKRRYVLDIYTNAYIPSEILHRYLS